MSREYEALMRCGRIFSPLYGGLMILRAWCYRIGLFKKHRLPVPVISIGNLTLGGTGKTPLVMYVVRQLQAIGRKPAIVSRGYGGTAKKTVNVVSDTKSILLEPLAAGDEPRLLAESLPHVPVLTGPKRSMVGRYAVEKFQCDSIVLDDGFQHLAVDRDLDLVLFSARTLLGDGWVFPGGRLREPLSALKRAHGFVITGVDAATKRQADSFKRYIKANFPNKPVFMGDFLPVCMLHSQKTKTFAIDKAKGLYLYGFAGIANPASFRHTLQKENFKLVGFESFRDHYKYTYRDAERLIKTARGKKAQALVTTEKDFVKLRKHFEDFPLLALKVELFMEEDFDLFLKENLGRFKRL